MKADAKPVSENSNLIHNQWLENFQKILRRIFNDQQSSDIGQKYQAVFSVDYQSLMPPRYAIRDIIAIENILKTKQPQVGLLTPSKEKNHFRLHFYSLQPRYLDEYFPVLGNLNLRVIDQVQFPLLIRGKQVFIKSFTIIAAKSQYASFGVLRSRLLNMIEAVLNEKVENDSLNSLLILTGLNWKEIDVLRAYRNYFLQLSYQTTLDSFHHALISNPEVTTYLFNYFETRFRPVDEWEDNMIREEQALFPIRIQLLEKIETVADINHDRILRTLFNLIDATVRSNYHVRCDCDDFFIAFKVKSLGIIDMPAPIPQNEIYVHGFDMEGIHLRGGKISRGGIRWSDRIDDFRTEILGLMQTQMSKNVLIIPAGAKGGFIVKRDCVDACFKEAGKKAYITFIQGLLDLTDNYNHGEVNQLPGIVSYDDPDPYLVVAADKGTAQFSDLANSVAADYHFWLADAFASGGSKGYSHKKLGITARGAWESVKRHFRELGKDIQKQAFSVVGIGSMDGDVFGNGMLLSQATQLLAAISGEHIFIDPAPADLKLSFLERKRLYVLPGSSWNDYDRQLISEGGGVFKRDSKDIPVAPVLKQWLGIRYNFIDGETLIRYLLKAPVDLLWLGGIGTYVKASTEIHSDAGDRNNDSVRLDAVDLRARVVGEGANLGFTQNARIEYSLSGGRINTDAIDNSAGVDISDHEVNLKILLMNLYKKKRIKDYSGLFNGLTQQICKSVLDNNYKQTLCLSIEQIRNSKQHSAYCQLADLLEASGFLNKQVESFPLEKELLNRQKQNLARPELAVLMAASKMLLTQQMLSQTAFLDNDCFTHFLFDYFPQEISKSYSEEVLSHPLAKEIKATCISNKIINQAGSLFILMSSEFDKKLLNNCLCYLTFDQVLAAEDLRQQVFDLDNKISTEYQYEMLQIIEEILLVFCRWALVNNKKIIPSDKTVKCYKQYFLEYRSLFQKQLINTETINKKIAHYKQAGIGQTLAEEISFLENIKDIPYLVALAIDTKLTLSTILPVYRKTHSYLGLDKVFRDLECLHLENIWEKSVCMELKNSIKLIADKLIKAMLEKSGENTILDFLSMSGKKQQLKQYQTIFQKINSLASVELIPYIALKDALAKLL